MGRWIDKHPLAFIGILVFILNFGSALFLSLSGMKFSIKDDTRTMIFTFSGNPSAGSSPPELRLTRIETKPEPLEKVRALRFMEALYFSTVTFATIGYGDIAPVSEAGRLFVIWLALSSVLLTLLGIPLVVAKLAKRDAP